MSQTLLSMAGFQVILIGRFWVIAERRGPLTGIPAEKGAICPRQAEQALQASVVPNV
jgi:hypothetical protein